MRSIDSLKSLLRVPERLNVSRAVARRRIVALSALAVVLYIFADFQRDSLQGTAIGTSIQITSDVSSFIFKITFKLTQL